MKKFDISEAIQMELHENLKSSEFYPLNMIITLAEFIPKSINRKKIIIGLSGYELSLGRKIDNFKGKIARIKIKELIENQNPRFRILKALSRKDMTFEELVKETGLSYDNLRWYILRNKMSLLNCECVKIKERKTYLYKNAKGGCVKIIFSITDRGKKELLSIKQNANLPRRKELAIITTEGEEIVLSSWWVSWLKPNINNLKFDTKQNRFLWKIPKKHMLVQYDKFNGSLYSSILPEEIEVNGEIFITSLGLLLGEMRKRQGEISFSNTEPNLANYVLKFFEYFGLSKNNFFFNVQVNTKNSTFDDNNIVNYWSNQLNISKDKISNIFEYKNYGTNRTEFGRIDFLYYNAILKEVINNLIAYFMNKAKKNKNYAVYLLRGLLASEGYVSASIKSGALSRVAISSESKENKKLIVKILKNLSISSSIYDNCISITSKDNYNKIIQYNLLKISKDKEKFRQLYNKFKYNKPILLSL